MIRQLLAALRSLLGTGRPDDLCALIEATAEPTPLFDETAAWAARIDAAVADFADEIDAIADAEYRELCEEGRDA